MMQLSDKSGIICDLCRTPFRDDFIYYSLDFRPVPISDNRKIPIDMIMQISVMLSIDACTMCFDKIKNDVIINYSVVRSKAHEAVTICELSGTSFTGNYTYHYVVVTRAAVNVVSKSMNTDQRHVEFNISDDVYREFVRKATDTAQAATIANQWSVQS